MPVLGKIGNLAIRKESQNNEWAKHLGICVKIYTKLGINNKILKNITDYGSEEAAHGTNFLFLSLF